MRTWTQITIDLQDTMPLVNDHNDSSSIHHAGFMTSSEHGRGFCIHFYPCHIELLKQVVAHLEAIIEDHDPGFSTYHEPETW